MRTKLLLCGTSLLLVLTACSGSGSGAGTGSTSIIPPVMAQTGYSNASLSGTYSVTFLSVYSLENEVIATANPYYSGTGTLKLDGAGNISGGTLNMYTSGATTPCVFTAGGTYAIQSTALGIATVKLSSGTTGCAPTNTWAVTLAVADGGNAIEFSRTDGNVLSGSAAKQ